MAVNKILVFDDDEDILSVTRIVLSKKGYEVETRNILNENIVDQVLSVNPDLIMMDLRMPIIGGEEATTKLKANEKTKNIPIIIFSANTYVERIAEKVKADGYIFKPFDIHAFTDTIEAVVNK